MKDILLGYDRNTGREIYVPLSSFATHWHLIGGTGKGKTNAIHVMLHGLLRNSREKACFFIIDRMGNLSYDLLLWLTSRFCPDFVRKRVVYIQPSREDVVIGFNPLLFDTQAHCFYRVSRATDIILRAWESVNIEAMPRLARWTFNTFFAAAQLGLTIADCVHFLMPGSPYHTPLLQCLPDRLRLEWQELFDARGQEATRLLESSRNRLKPYFESDILRRMFGSTRSRLDVLRFMREGRVVIINLAAQNRLSEQLADAIGGLILNDILCNCRSLPLGERYPTYVLLDEFQRFVGPDLEFAIPETRQFLIRLILSHQSFSQLKRGDYDLRSIIYTAQSRLILGLQGLDADEVAHELAANTFDPKRIKEELYHKRQRVVDHKIIELSGWADAESEARNWTRQNAQGWSAQETRQRLERVINNDTIGTSKGQSGQRSEGEGGSASRTRTHNVREQLVPVYEEVEELSSRTYYGPEEWERVWAREVRGARTGEGFLRLVDDAQIYETIVKYAKPGYLAWDIDKIARKMPQALERIEQMLEANFSSDLFVTPAMIDRESELRLETVLHPPIIINSGKPQAEPPKDPFV